MALFYSGEGLALYLHLVLDSFVSGLVFPINHSVDIPFLLLSESDLGLLPGLGWSSLW